MKEIIRAPHSILVTGGAGFIGSAFIRYLLKDEGFSGRVVNVDALTYAGNLDNVAEVADDPRYCFVKGDICDYNLIDEMCRNYAIDTIVHFAAESHVDRSIGSPAAFIETNIVGTFRLLEVVRNRPHIHFHHISTDEVYGALGADGVFTEMTPYNPSSPYSSSKAASDHLVRAYGATYNISMTISNCSNNYGPYQHPEKLIPLMITSCLEKEALPIYGKGLNIRDWLYVDDHVDAIYCILRYGRRGETYAIGGGEEKKNIDIVYDIIRAVAEMTGDDEEELHSRITFVTDRLGHDFRYAIDFSKLHNELGWSPKYSFVEGLRNTVRWYTDKNVKNRA